MLRVSLSFIVAASALFSQTMITAASQSPLNLSNSPLLTTQTAAPLTMLILGRNHKLFYEAYNNASDLDGDGVLDIKYTPSIDYYGYFDPYKCYRHQGGWFGRFVPVSVTATKKCGVVAGSWSGNFMNYLTTTRMDALRKVLYGGYRRLDTASQTILQRSHTTQDGHSWGIEYRSIAVDGYDIREYTPYNLPNPGRYHLFANTTLLNGSLARPLVRVLQNQSYRIWDWVSIERPVAGNRVLHGGSGPWVWPTDYAVNVQVCEPTVGLEKNCRLYPTGKYKPVGLLQELGENDSIKFGLLSGSFTKNLSGGVLRKNIESFKNEVNPNTGQFVNNANGIVNTIDRLMIPGFLGNYEHQLSCGFIFNRKIREGECRAWGNPIAEMMYESTRYFSGKTNPTSAFTYGNGWSDDRQLGLPKPSWKDPYAQGRNPYCAKPNALVISDISPNYDTDQLPGTAFGSFSGDLNPSLNVSTLANQIWNTETGGGTKQHFIGQSGSVYDGSPSPKSVSSFANIRGLSPDEPTKEGGYYSASVSYYGWLNDVNPIKDKQQLQSFFVAMDSPLPRINIKTGANTITLIPFAKSVGGCGGINPAAGAFQPTNTIVDFYVQQISATQGTFRINFEDVEQGADHDMDAVAMYSYTVNPDNSVSVTLDSTYAGGCVIQHIGYVISGTTADGTYLEVRDRDTSAGSDPDYFLDTPPGQNPNGTWQDTTALPLTTTRTFYPSSNPAATFLKDPLWYAAKWGGFTDTNNNNKPDLAEEWDSDNNGVPDNYFLVSNPINLKQQLTKALYNILDRTSSMAAGAVNIYSLTSSSRIYQTLYSSKDWAGQILSYKLDPNTGQILQTGSGPQGSEWDAAQVLKGQNFNTGRAIITYKPSETKSIAFRWPANPSSPTQDELDATQVTALNTNPNSGTIDNRGEDRLDFVRGDRSKEQKQGGTFRNRTQVLGDIIHSNLNYIGSPAYPYSDAWPTGSPENASAYSAFKTTYKTRPPIVYVGANDGMLHAFNAKTGQEVFAYIPGTVMGNLPQLSAINYSHRYYVDGAISTGEAFFGSKWHTVITGGLNRGGQGVYALDVTDPSAINESNASKLVLWEFTDKDDPDLGYTYSQPVVARLANGKWAAIFGNGYNNIENDGTTTRSTTGNAVLYIVDIETGNLIKKLDTGVGMTSDPNNQGRPNGLSSPAVVDVDGDYIADYVYAGDLFGNLWKFKINKVKPAKWKVAFRGRPLFVAKNQKDERQPITSRPTVGQLQGASNTVQIYFGTGKYIETQDNDVTNAPVETFYGITDSHSGIVRSRNRLLQQSILSEITVTNPKPSEPDHTVRVTSDNKRSTSHKGWYMDLEVNNLAVGERVIRLALLRNGRVIFTSMTPSSQVCEFGGTGWIMEVNAYDGARLGFSPFDLDQDGDYTNKDFVNYVNGSVTENIPSTGIKSSTGVIPTPSIVSAGKTEYKYTPGSSGAIGVTSENARRDVGRQTWKQFH